MKKLTYGMMFLLGIILFTTCQNDSSTDPVSGEQGTLLIKITDAPFPLSMVEEANVTINNIEIRRAQEYDEFPFITVFDDLTTINLIHLRNEITEDLAEIAIPVGDYNLVRLYIAEASIVLTDGREFQLKVPSGAETGIKIFVDPAINVESGLTSELLLDFDLSQSFVVQGNPFTPAGIQGFIFKPVIRAVNITKAGRIVGTVTDTEAAAVAEAHVWVEQDSIVSSTFADSLGVYGLIGLPAGHYSAYATQTGYDTVAVSDVNVVAGNRTVVDFELTR